MSIFKKTEGFVDCETVDEGYSDNWEAEATACDEVDTWDGWVYDACSDDAEWFGFGYGDI